VVAGIVVVLWFLVMDLVAGHPFDTPARLSSAVLRTEFSGPWPRLIMLYTVLHFGVFLALGVATVWTLEMLRIQPGLLVGGVFAVGVLNAVHYAGLLVTGTNLLTIVPIQQVALANLFGGTLMMAYLHRALGSREPFGWNVLRRYPILFEGLATGLVGAATVAIWFLIVDLLAGSPLHTPAALGSAVLLNAANATEIELNLGVMLAYSILHLSVFVAVGIAFSWLVQRLQGAPAFGARALAILLALEGLFIGSVGMASGWIVQEIGWVTILGANGLAVTGMSLWIWQHHPDLKAQAHRSESEFRPGAVTESR
jgi:hypothetical protein